MSYDYYDFNHPRPMVQIDCGHDGCDKKDVVPARIFASIGEGGEINIGFDYEKPTGWSHDKKNHRYICARHDSPVEETK